MKPADIATVLVMLFIAMLTAFVIFEVTKLSEGTIRAPEMIRNRVGR